MLWLQETMAVKIWTTSLCYLAVFILSGTAGESNETIHSNVHKSNQTNQTDVISSIGFRTVAEMDCPRGWDIFGSRCFKFVQTFRSWIAAEQYCLRFEGNLASVHSADEYNFLQQIILRYTNELPPTWIGGYDAVQEGVWLWSDGSKFDFSSWNAGEPNNFLGNEHCIQMNFPDGYGWNDARCSNHLSFVCSREKYHELFV